MHVRWTSTSSRRTHERVLIAKMTDSDKSSSFDRCRIIVRTGFTDGNRVVTNAQICGSSPRAGGRKTCIHVELYTHTCYIKRSWIQIDFIRNSFSVLVVWCRARFSHFRHVLPFFPVLASRELHAERSRRLRPTPKVRVCRKISVN